MKKGKYIDYYVLLACLSKKPEPQQPVDEIISNAMANNNGDIPDVNMSTENETAEIDLFAEVC